MATAITSFDKLQIAFETTKGTLVPATRLLPGKYTLSEEQEYYRSAYADGFRANPGGLGATVKKGYVIDAETDLDASDFVWMMLLGVFKIAAPTGATEFTWTGTPELTTGVPSIDSATMECIKSDGVTNHYYGEVGYAMLEMFKIDWNVNQAAKLTWKAFARSRQTGTPTASLVPYTDREPLVANSVSVFWDLVGGAIGTTQLTGLMRSASLEVMTGYGADFVMDGRVDRDFGKHNVGDITAKLSLTMELDATGASRLADYRANSGVLVRLKNTGGVVGSGLKTVQCDGAFRFTTPPSFSEDGKQVLMSCEMESYRDPTYAKTLEFLAINARATRAAL